VQTDRRLVKFHFTGDMITPKVASWFNYINRVAYALGVGRE
jgi:hypothetical protein